MTNSIDTTPGFTICISGEFRLPCPTCGNEFEVNGRPPFSLWETVPPGFKISSENMPLSPGDTLRGEPRDAEGKQVVKLGRAVCSVNCAQIH